MGRWDQNGPRGDWLEGCGLDSTGSGQGPVAGYCECGDEPSGSCATEVVSWLVSLSCELHIPANLAPGKSPRDVQDRRLRGRACSVLGGKRKYLKHVFIVIYIIYIGILLLLLLSLVTGFLSSLVLLLLSQW
jgi:hypothetical protein